MLAVKQTGVALVLAILIDATLVRMLLVPATMSVLGDQRPPGIGQATSPTRKLDLAHRASVAGCADVLGERHGFSPHAEWRCTRRLLQQQIAAENIEAMWISSEQQFQHSAIIVARTPPTRTTMWVGQPRTDRGAMDKIDHFLDGADAVLPD